VIIEQPAALKFDRESDDKDFDLESTEVGEGQSTIIIMKMKSKEQSF